MSSRSTLQIQAPPLAQNIRETKAADKTSSASDVKKTEDAQKVGRDFEAILVRQMLAKTNMGGKGGYGDMATEAFASAVTAGGGLGFGKVIADQLAPHHAVTKAVPAHPSAAVAAFKKA